MREKTGKVPNDLDIHLFFLPLEWNCIFLYTEYNNFYKGGTSMPPKPPRIKKILSWITTLVLAAAVLAFNIPFPVSRTYACLEINREDPYVMADRTVTVTGTYRLNLARPDTFTGTIEISDLPETQSPIPCPILIGGNVSGYYSYNENDTPVFGELACGRFLRHPIFVLCGGESETYLVPGAKNMGQAIYDVDRFYAPSWAWFNHRPADPA